MFFLPFFYFAIQDEHNNLISIFLAAHESKVLQREAYKIIDREKLASTLE